MTHPPASATVQLHLEPEHLRLVPPSPAAPCSTPLGWHTVARAFGQRMPTALGLENAIATVENAVMPAARALPPGPVTLHTASPLLREVAQAAGADLGARPTRLARAAVEHLFNRLADQVQRPGHADPALPQRPDFAAALLILREALHHWEVEWVELEG
ncbi:MAG: hypothetical protein J7556_02100 [Acidovorax sp.]|nr:hypothetical protein [Acidovorax sp.]